MKLVAVAAVLVVLLACLARLESAPSVVVSEDVARRELETFERALFADEDKNSRNKRGWFKKVLKGAALAYVAGKVLGKRDLDGFSEYTCHVDARRNRATSARHCRKFHQ